VRVTTRQQSPIASRALAPSGRETSCGAGAKPQTHRPCSSTVRRGPSVTVRPPRSTVTVIGRPWLPPTTSRPGRRCASSGRRPRRCGRPDGDRRRQQGVRLDLRDLGARILRRCARRIDREEDDEGHEHVHARTRGDRGEALPGRLAPVRVGTAPLVDVSHRLLGGAASRRSQLRLLESRAQRRHGSPGGLEVAAHEWLLHRLRDGAERGIFAKPGRHGRLEVGGRGPLHAGDADVASERNRGVLDPLPPNLHERRPEADVERARLHPDEPCDREVPELVQEDEQAEPEDDDEPGHRYRSGLVTAPTAAKRDSGRASGAG
jgi:hypothetical protein